MLLTGLDLAHRIAGTPLSDAVTAAVRADRTAARLAEEARTAFISPDPDAMRQATIAGFHLAARERLRDRCRYVLRMIFTPTYSDWWAFSFVKHARFLVYVLRPFRLLGVLFSRGRRFTSRPGMT